MSPDAPDDAFFDDASSCALDFRNLNTLWASIMVETLFRLGLQTAIVCPGSRSAPLTVAFAQHPKIEAIPVLDERSASFFALGIARRSGNPVVLVCTSGSAGANFYGAVIEAKESGVPLLILTADRPPELRHCHAGQAIDQLKLFGHYPNWQTELALPEAKPALLAYLRQTLVQAWERAQFPAGPVHLNVPLRDPLAPVADDQPSELAQRINPEQFFKGIQPAASPTVSLTQLPDWSPYDRGLIIVGLEQPKNPAKYCEAIAQLSKTLGWPVLTDALNPLRNFQSLNPNLIGHYDQILRSPHQAKQLEPNAILRIGELPTSKVLRQWLTQQSCQQWVVSDRPENFDPLHSHTNHLRTSLAHLVQQLPSSITAHSQTSAKFLQTWKTLDQTVSDAIAQTFQSTEDLVESKIAWLLSQHLPAETPLFIANSTPVRDMEWFWQKGDRQILPYFNRGANGIDGTLSTAIGIAAASDRPCVMLTGDLALLHDTNGFLLAKGMNQANAQSSGASKLKGHLTIVLINNNGGGIFELLPISEFEPPFEDFFATPQAIAFSDLCQTYGVEHIPICSWQTLATQLQQLPPISGVRVLEVRTDRKHDSLWRKQFFATILATLASP